MKKIILLFQLFTFPILPQTFTFHGVVKDVDTKENLQFANILIKGSGNGTTSNENGEFLLSGNFRDTDTLIVSYIGYKSFIVQLADLKSDFLNVYLQKIILPSQTILVEAGLGKTGLTPIAFNKISKVDIQKDYILQDIPNYLSQLPSTTFYSENGNGIGYNYLSIRGFDQRRISVSVNGIPQNDPEDHNVYWLDFPDILSSTELIQVQRGAGSGITGYPAVGGSINIITSPFSEK
ncbi:MAG TPA: TonB-dependent receptor, partial [Ignavibacteriaceae bacterium]